MITIISATNRPKSNARVVSEVYAAMLDQRHIPSQILDLIDLPHDFTATALYSNSGKSEGFNRLVEILNRSEKVVFVVPEYNVSFPGVLKAFIDGLSYPNTLQNKKAALVGISTGIMGGALALSHLTDVLNYLGMHVLSAKPRLMHIHKNLHEGKITNSLYLELMQQQIDQFIKF
jgi:NAD(P)H-dependent FMN reductase